MINKKHLTESGLLEIVNIKASFKKGLNSNLIKSFPHYKPIIKPEYKPNLNLINDEWISGFINTDGSFGLNISKSKSKTKILAFRIIPMIRVYQDIISLIVLNKIKQKLNCGYILNPSKGRNVATLVFSNNDSINKIIDLCNKNILLGSKKKDFLDFCKGYKMYLNKEHLNIIGLQKIINLSRGMNSGRKFD